MKKKEDVLMEIKFNINECVKVKLTPIGVQILKDEHNELRKACPSIGRFKLKLDKDGYYKCQLHVLFNTFGEYINVGSETPFETEIVLLKD